MSLSTKIAIGTVQFGLDYGISNKSGKTTFEEANQILNFCLENNISCIDTASAYGDAEVVLGKIGCSNFNIVTKFINPLSLRDFQHGLQNSFERLNINSIYGYLSHRPEELLKSDWLWHALNDVKAEGKVTKIGYSLNHPDELDALLEKGYVPDIIQVPYSYVDRRFEPFFKKLKSDGVEIHSRSCFLQGLLLMKANELSDFFNPIKPFLKALESATTNRNGTLLRFVLSNPFIDKVVLGVETLAQLKSNISDAEVANDLAIELPNLKEAILMPSKWIK